MWRGIFRIVLNALWLYGISASFIHALPTVESRTGEPVLSTQTQHRSPQPLISPNNDTVQSRAEKNAMVFNEMEMLQKEISELKGQLETQQHEIKQLKKSQQDLYLDLDRRVSQIQTVKKTKAENTNEIKKTNEIAKSNETKKMNEIEKPNESKKTNEVVKTNEPKKINEIGKTTEIKNTSANETLLYHSAYNMVKNKRYNEAVTEFQKYLNQFPKGEHVANAHYWLGEMYVLQWQNDHSKKALLDQASMEFLTITTQFPNHTKTADAHLKLGIVELDKGNTEIAKQHFLETKTRFPDTSAARVAENRLLQLP